MNLCKQIWISKYYRPTSNDEYGKRMFIMLTWFQSPEKAKWSWNWDWYNRYFGLWSVVDDDHFLQLHHTIRYWCRALIL